MGYVAFVFLLATLFLTGRASAGDTEISPTTILPPEGKAPTVKAIEIERPQTPLISNEDDSGEMLRPNHPPIDQIPPLPMPQPPDFDQQPLSEEPGQPIIYNPATGEETLLPLKKGVEALEGAEEPVKINGYNGVDGGGGTEAVPASFYDMYQITNTGSFPWRMNCKLVMRFGGNWYVASGVMIDASTVHTAGHCVHQGGGGSWADEIWVYPGYDGTNWGLPPDDSVGAYGVGYGTLFASWTKWTQDGDFDYDVGVIKITRSVGQLTGWFGTAYGGSCSWHKSQTYNNASYPAEDCPIYGLHNGLDMYYWYGNFDDCPGNQLQLNTGGGNCFDTVWGGMSGSGAYFIDTGRYVHAVCSTSNRTTRGYYCRIWDDWSNYLYSTFIPDYCRGNTFDLQPLDVNAGPSTIEAGTSTTLLDHLATNATNGDIGSKTYTLRIYLSSNDYISTADTYLSTQYYSWDFDPMSSVRVNMSPVTIPETTPPGTWWVGLIYDSATDANSSNNNTKGWDCAKITVTAETNPPTPNPMTWKIEPYETSKSSISMVATTASDPNSPIDYYFDFYTSPTGGSGGTDSGWQSSASYTDSQLSTNHQYGYRVRARDKYSNQTSWSAISYDYTDIEPSDGPQFGTITSSSIQVRSSNTPSGLARGNSGIIIYNLTNSHNSGWKQDNNYWTDSGLSPNSPYSFTVNTRNGDGDPTGWSPDVTKYTLANPPGKSSFSDITQTSIRANWTVNGNPNGTQLVMTTEN